MATSCKGCYEGIEALVLEGVKTPTGIAALVVIALGLAVLIYSLVNTAKTPTEKPDEIVEIDLRFKKFGEKIMIVLIAIALLSVLIFQVLL